jgi:two-component system NarL family response regulator
LPAISLLLVDDHPVVREGLKAMISMEPDIQVIAEAGNGAGAVRLFFELRPNVVLMDLLLPDMHGSEAIRRICSKSGDASIIVITSSGGDEDIYRALEAGARGYLFKDMVPNDLILAIRAIHSGKRYIPGPVGACMIENLPRSGLSSREIEVLQLVAMGMRNKEIAPRLVVSEATINAHVKHILEKLNASDRTQAVTMALRRGIIKI